jgi:hypothetical protein
MAIQNASSYHEVLGTTSASTALSPGSDGKVETLLQERNHDVWGGENTSPGCSYDVAMHGRSVHDAQPAVIFCSLSKICRRNAQKIIASEDIAVDPRGIGMEYYRTGPDFFASSADDVGLALGEEGPGMFQHCLTDLHSPSRRPFKSSSSSHRSTLNHEGISRQQRTTGKGKWKSNICPFYKLYTGRPDLYRRRIIWPYSCPCI